MAEAGADFRKSIAMFEKLMGEQRGDTVIRRYFADALGLKGMGCYLRFTHRPQEAERFYRRAIELRRDLVRGNGARTGRRLPTANRRSWRPRGSLALGLYR